MVYIPYGILCIAITILIINSFKKVRENKKTNRSIRNSERFQNTISMLQARKEREKEKQQNNEFS
jgi:hypothetical protein